MTEQSRRNFLQTAGVALASSTASRLRGADDKVNVAVVGLGGRGTYHMGAYAKLPDARVAAVCDVNQEALERGQALIEKLTGHKPKGYADMRQVFDDKEIQAVSMPLPNHWHALSTIWACQAGKDVYVEKPACYNPFEGQMMVEAAAGRIARPDHCPQNQGNAVTERRRDRENLPCKRVVLQASSHHWT